MLANVYKISDEEDIKHVLSEGKFYQTDIFGVAVLKREDQDPPKFAFIVSAKISKLAVHRNRINRALNEGVRQTLSRCPRGYSFVFLVKKAITSKITEDIMKEIQRFLINTNLK